jgi:excisionase family DNA binding protein
MVNLLTVKQVAFILKVHPLTVRRYIRETKLPAVKVAGGVRIREEDLGGIQKGYSVRRRITAPIPEKIKTFTYNDPLWKLEGAGASLSLPTED